MHTNTPREAGEDDLAALLQLEQRCFEQERRASRRSLRQSIRSATQRVRVLDSDGRLAAAAVHFIYPRSLRIYSIATAPEYRGQGLGRILVEDATRIATGLGKTQIILEAAADDQRLLSWYDALGLRRIAILPDYYAAGQAAVRMRRRVP